MRLIQQSGAIVGLSVILALLVAFAHPKAPSAPWLTPADTYRVGFEALENLDTIIWVDARTKAAYDSEHAPGAIHLNEDNWEGAFFTLLEGWTPEQTIIVYCNAKDCHASEVVAQRLRRDLDIDDVYYLEGGGDSLKELLR
jgi:rhodanese-related sulfurtransferase|tara:strand:- start:2430 stop:2852 length:423 start_codon:yes stop_codon:yes gene_type:complete